MNIFWIEGDVPFPPASLASPMGDGLLAIGGDYSVPRLLAAYTGGIFPWSTFRGHITWHSPDPRFVLLPHNFHVPQSLRRILKKHPFQITVDRAFDRVISACATVPREEGHTWINNRLLKGYTTFHEAGYAHSVEAWQDGELVGGFYGVSVKGVFCGESMFTLQPNATKCAFATVAPALFEAGCAMIDCQTHSDHMERFGAAFMTREEYLRRLESTAAAGHEINWRELPVPFDS